jgi:hypothetical protein
MCNLGHLALAVVWSGLASIHFLVSLLGKEDQSVFKMPRDQDNSGTGDFTSASNENNIIHPIDQLPKYHVCSTLIESKVESLELSMDDHLYVVFYILVWYV